MSVISAFQGSTGGGGAILGRGAPAATTSARVGQQYLDQDNGTTYTCVAVAGDGKTTWQISGASDAAMVSSGDATVQSALDAKQNTLTFDSTPTSGSANPVTSGGVYTALSGKAPLASPVLTGTPTAPTAASSTNSTQIATTAFVQNVLASGGSVKTATVTFTASQWSNGTMTIAASTHGITGSVLLYNFLHLVNGSYVPGTWACVESWAEINASTHVITLHGPTTSYAGKVVLLG